MSPPETKDRILDVAEQLFAEKGFAATSLRGITAAAEVNLASVHYHFGSKEGLFLATFERRIEPVNRERIALLDALESESDQPDLEELLRAFLLPAMRLARTDRGAVFMRLFGRAYTEPGEHWQPIAAQFDEVKLRFLPALQRALPDLSPAELFWRVHFMIGVMCHTLADTHRLAHLSCGLCNPTDVDGLLDQLLPFLAAGFRAPAPSTSPETRA